MKAYDKLQSDSKARAKLLKRSGYTIKHVGYNPTTKEYTITYHE